MMQKELQGSHITIYIEDDAKVDWGAKEVFKLIEDAISCIEDFLYSDETILLKSEHPLITLDLHFCSDEKMRALNLEHRSKDKTTDVLSFPLAESLRKGSDEFIIPGEISLGDIIISRDVASMQAEEFNISVAEEVIHLFVHGLLHLLGFDHEISQKEEVIMQDHEKNILQSISKSRA